MELSEYDYYSFNTRHINNNKVKHPINALLCDSQHDKLGYDYIGNVYNIL